MFKLEDVSYFKLKIWTDSSEEDMSKVRIGQKLDFLCQTVSQVANAKDKSLEDVKSATIVSTWIIRKGNSLVAEMEKVLAV